MISHSWKKFLSSQGSGGAGHARPPCEHVHSPAPRPGTGSGPPGTRLSEIGAPWLRVLWRKAVLGSRAEEQVSTASHRSALAAAVLGVWLGAGRMPAPFVCS